MSETVKSNKTIPNNLRINLASIPPDQAGVPLTRKRSEGPFPRVPNTAILSICKHMERNGYTKDHYEFYDFEMLYPTNDEVREYYSKYRPHLVGLSVPISTGYSHVKNISKLLEKFYMKFTRSHLLKMYCLTCIIIKTRITNISLIFYE